MLVKDLYYVKLKNVRTNLRCSLQRALSDICRYLCEVLFWAQGSFLIQMQEKVFGKFFFGRNIRFLHLEILRYLLLSKERIKKQKKTNFTNFTNLLVKILTFCIQVKTYVTVPIRGICFKKLIVC